MRASGTSWPRVGFTQWEGVVLERRHEDGGWALQAIDAHDGSTMAAVAGMPLVLCAP